LEATLKENRKILWSVLVEHLNFSRKNSILVISTAREFLLTKIEFINFLILIIAKPDILCIRNPSAWYFNKKNFGRDKIIYNLNSAAAILIRQILIRRATFVICESQSQVRLITSKFKGKNELNCISFPGRLTDVKPIGRYDGQISNGQKRLKLGLLGSVDDKKRNYEMLLKAIEVLEVDRRPIVFFLGSRLPANSDYVIQKFKNLTEVFHSFNNRISETDFYNFGKQCDVLISPLKYEVDYGANFGTGSVADGILLEKMILLPKFIEIDETLNSMFLRYENSIELSQYLSENSIAFIISNFFNEWTIQGIREKLGLDKTRTY
jgi:hypothetical protein